jgi:transcriptional regulator with XRE-family HTH domain
MGKAIVHLRERRGMDREEMAEKIEEEPATLEKVERGETDAGWAILRVVAHAVREPLYVLTALAEERAPGAGGAEWRRKTREAEAAGGFQRDAGDVLVLPAVTAETFGESELFDLDDRMAFILQMRSGMLSEKIPTLREVGEELGISPERVRQLERHGLALIRQVREVQRHLRLPPQGRRYRYPWGFLRRFGT